MPARSLAVIALAWAVSFITTRLTRRYAATLGLLDAPNERSSHAAPTPNGGGLGLVLAGSLSAIGLSVHNGRLWVVLLSSLVIAGVGLRDDVRHVAASIRFAVQLLVVGAAVVALGLFDSAHPLIPVVVILGGVWWINLFNFMDGIDGIAATQAIVMLVSAAALAAWRRPEIAGSAEWMWMIAVAAAVLAFLQLNWPPATIFMGDVGSTWLAYIIFCVAAFSVLEGWLTSPVWLILGAAFIADSTTTLLRRMVNGARWFEAHRSHAYQRLAVRLNAHRPVTLLSTGINVLWVAPLAFISLVMPQWEWFLVAAAYAPIVVGVLWLGAGKANPPITRRDR